MAGVEALAPINRAYAIIPAAGSGSRMGAGINKQFLEIDGLPILVRTLRTFAAHAGIDGIVVVAKAEEQAAVRQMVEDMRIPKILDVVVGGVDRQASVLEGLRALERRVNDAGTTGVLIHDGARCFLQKETIDRCLETLQTERALTVAIPLVDTIAEVTFGKIKQVPDRSLFWRVQTPQSFRFSDIMSWHVAVEGEDRRFTDDSAIAIACGVEVAIVQGTDQNIKITTAFDLKLAALISKSED